VQRTTVHRGDKGRSSLKYNPLLDLMDVLMGLVQLMEAPYFSTMRGRRKGRKENKEEKRERGGDEKKISYA
jgi:hypothetical protein